MRWLALAALLLVGCLGIDTPDGVLMCSTTAGRPCPSGFYCLQPANTCWRYGHFPTDMATPVQIVPADFSVVTVDND